MLAPGDLKPKNGPAAVGDPYRKVGTNWTAAGSRVAEGALGQVEVRVREPDTLDREALQGVALLRHGLQVLDTTFNHLHRTRSEPVLAGRKERVLTEDNGPPGGEPSEANHSGDEPGQARMAPIDHRQNSRDDESEERPEPELRVQTVRHDVVHDGVFHEPQRT